MLRIKKNDLVIAIAGKNKGKKGKVLKIFPRQNKVIVERLNMFKKNVRPSQKNQQGGIISQEAPLHLSNVMLFCSRCAKAVGFRNNVLKDGSKIRICKKCGERI